MTDGPGDLSALVEEVADVARVVFVPGNVEDTLRQIVAAAVRSVDSCDMAGVIVVHDGQVRSVAVSDPLAAEIADLQINTGEGPCLDALTDTRAIYAGDLAGDGRYPRFGGPADAAGIRSVLAYQLPVDHAAGALNLYAGLPDAFGVYDRAKALILAAIAAGALSAAADRRDAQQHSDHLVQAVASREIIGQAQGILIERERITPDQAFDVLRRASQHLNRKLRDVAQDLVDTGESPPTGSPR
jgi:hypothetical protein